MRKDLEGCLSKGGNFIVKSNCHFFKAIVKFGHVGKNKFIEREISTCAYSKKEAIDLMRNMPRCKTQLEDAVVKVKEISADEYKTIKIKNWKDPYFRCKTQFDIKRLCPDIDKEIKTLKSKRSKAMKNCKAKIRIYHEKFDRLLINQANEMIRNYL